MLKIQTLVVTDFQQNCRILIDDTTNESVLVDPGGDAEYIHGAVVESGSTLKAIVLTHSHIDHCAGVSKFLELHKGDLPLLGHEVESTMRSTIDKQAMMFRMDPNEYQNCPEPTQYIDDGYVLNVGKYQAIALFTPGHSPGHLSFYFENVDWQNDSNSGSGPLLIAGDALFHESIGRTDLPGGNGPQLIESIKTRLMTLPDDTTVLCGHGQGTTIGHERTANPFLK